jgi:hypothetical protein
VLGPEARDFERRAQYIISAARRLSLRYAEQLALLHNPDHVKDLATHAVERVLTFVLSGEDKRCDNPPSFLGKVWSWASQTADSVQGKQVLTILHAILMCARNHLRSTFCVHALTSGQGVVQRMWN